MADFTVDDASVHLRFGALEVLGALRTGATASREAVASIDVVENPWEVLRGLRVGTAFPWVVVLGTMLRPGGNDVVAVYGQKPAVVVQFRAGSPYRRWIATAPDAEATAAELRRALEG